MSNSSYISGGPGKLSDYLPDLFLKHSPGLIWILDESGTLIFANESFFNYFELTPSSLQTNLSDILSSGNADILYAIYLRVLETGLPYEVSEMLRKSDRTTTLFHISSFPVILPSGEKLVGGYAVSLVNEHNNELKLKEVNEHLSLLKKTVSNAIWEWDLRTGHISRNDILMNMIGYRPEKEQGLAWWLRRIHPEDRDIVSEKIKTTIDRGQQSWEIDYRFKCADDDYKLINDHGFIIYENGFPVKIVGSLKEISYSELE
jgi:PAS domain S-box-containing protein